MSSMDNLDVIVIGAGAAGLAAAIRLGSAGLSTLVIEARERIGGRMFTQRDPVSQTPVELGAEFIHGRPPEILELLKTNRITITEVEGDSWCIRNGSLSRCNFFSQVDDILGKMDDQSPDESFLTFLNRCCADPRVTADAKQRALAYVSGFNAADPALVGVHWLVESMRAEEKIEGDRAFRSRNGYADLITIFQQQLVDASVSMRTGTVVETVRWSRGRVEVTAMTSAGTIAFVARRVLVTLPLGVLQAPAGAAGAVQFLPTLPDHKHLALGKLEMGKAIRITLRFRRRFWEDIAPTGRAKSLANLSLLFTQDVWFPTWWTPMPDPSPLITGWAPFSFAERLSGKGPDFVIARALETLGRALHVPIHELEGLLEHAYSHDWQNDPYSRGAYSYGAVGSDGMQATLGSPVEETLYFAGEATDVTGNNGTVNGAIASGLRAAAEILADTSPGAYK
jgi:monoamine oxidase